MSSKHTPNWTQRVEEHNPSKVVHTQKNTSLEDWTSMVNIQISAHKYEGTIRPLELLHGWEFDETPYSFVQKYVGRARKETARAI
jgi:hypothetical protein